VLSPVNSRRVDQPETGCCSMRNSWTLVALGGALFLAVTGTSTAQADTTGGISTGNGGNSAGPATAGSIQSTSGQTPTVSYEPAFATDLPKGSSSLSPTSSAASAAVAPAVSWICSGTGTETYRIVTDGWQGTYHKAVQSLNHLTTTC